MKKILVALFVSCVALIGCNNNQEGIEELSQLVELSEHKAIEELEELYQLKELPKLKAIEYKLLRTGSPIN